MKSMPANLGKNLSLCFSIIKRPSLALPTSSAAATVTNPAISDQTDSDSDMPDAVTATPDFAAVYASHRFFFSSPGRSNSIVDSSSTTSSSLSMESLPETEEESGVAVQTYSEDPYRDFRQSMEEMVEARGLHEVGESWTRLQELLLCYLSLNPKSTHKFIVAAFSDLLLSLMSPAPPGVSSDTCFSD